MKPSDLMKRIIFNCNNKDGKGDNILLNSGSIFPTPPPRSLLPIETGGFPSVFY